MEMLDGTIVTTATPQISRSLHARPAEVGEEGIAVMRAIKRALDPLGLLNPGKVLVDAPEPALAT